MSGRNDRMKQTIECREAVHARNDIEQVLDDLDDLPREKDFKISLYKIHLAIQLLGIVEELCRPITMHGDISLVQIDLAEQLEAPWNQKR